MKILILTLAILMSAPFIAESAQLPVQSEMLSASKTIRIFGIGKPKYNKRKMERQNSPSKIFRRGKKLQRKNGIAYIIGKNLDHAA